MAPLSVPPELKKIKPFIQRAEELDHAKSPESRVVAFYCRQFAVQQGIPLSGTSPAAKKCLGELLGQLEGEKQAMSVFNRPESKQICRSFADKIFDKANAEDRAGVANKGTARTFYAAASFFEILQQFNDDTTDEDLIKEEDERRVYAKWKATDILKAIREGRTPTPGAFGESAEDEDAEGEDAGGGEEDDAAGSTDDGPSPLPPPAYEAPPSAPVESPPPVVQPAAPDVYVPSPPPASRPEPDEGDDEGTEVGLKGPPPAYPGSDDDDDDDDGDVFVPGAVKSAAATAGRSVDRPPLTAAYESPPPPMVPKASPPPVLVPAPAPAAAPKSSFSSRWGLGKKDSGRVSKKALEDASELTKFALAALESKDSDLAARRLQEALSALGR